MPGAIRDGEQLLIVTTKLLNDSDVSISGQCEQEHPASQRGLQKDWVI